MNPKVKVGMVQDGDYVTYTIRSKSLTAALGRATLLAQAIGTDHMVEIVHEFRTNKKGKQRHEITVYVTP